MSGIPAIDDEPVINDETTQEAPVAASDDRASAPAAPSSSADGDNIHVLMDRAAAAGYGQMAQKTPSTIGAAGGASVFSADKIPTNRLSVFIWGGAGLSLSAVALALYASRGAIGDGVLLMIGMGFAAGLMLLVAFLTRADRIRRRREIARSLTMSDHAGPSALAGAAMLQALNLSEKVLDSDEEARLLARRDGVVAYANQAYLALAREAGVSGMAGLPPRIDRLFSQQGSEATKLFRLCRAAKSGKPAQETIYQLMGLKGGGVRRRFDVSVRPVAHTDNFVSWIVREAPAEDAQHDAIASAYANFIQPVFAIEKSGQIAWTNAALRERLGAERGALTHIDDIALGETADLVSTLWRVDRTEVEALVRRRADNPLEATLTAFRRGGVGEGFVCVFVDIDEESAAPANTSMPANMTDAPFGAAVVEGEIGRDASIIEANKAFTDVFGATRSGSPLARALPTAALEDIAAEIKRKSAAGGAPRAVEASVGEGSAHRHFAFFARPVPRRRGSYGVKRTLLYSVEITDRKRMEQDHAQDQKLKALGHIAGGVAHDFNNLLQVILGNCEHLMLRHPAGDPAYGELVLIRENAQRAANLTKQLLAYSRKQTLTPRVQSITDILVDFARFLNRAVGEKVKLDLDNGRGLPNVKVDRNQLETAIMNLAVNARDAMAPDGGVLRISTRFVACEEIRILAIADLDLQDYVEITVADTGPGVPQEIIDKIFDPFFTTKDEGKGTGLGLSTVYGVIGQMGGAIVLDREAAEGAVFRIYLPASSGDVEIDDAGDTATPGVASGDLTGTGRILVVEDEDPVRAIVVATLKRSGYDVTAVADGVDALETIEDGAAAFDLVISDIMMPELDGPTFVARAREEHGVEAGVIFMSGYAETAMREQLDRIEDAGYLQKPFPMTTLAAKVKEVLQARKSAH